MRRAGRNDPCPCNSRKKYKRCCADKDAEADRNNASGRSSAKPISTSLASRGPFGQRLRLTITPQFQGKDHQNHPQRLGAILGRRKFSAVFTLGKPGVQTPPETSFSFDPAAEGDSHLLVTHEAPSRPQPVRFSTVTPDGTQLNFAAVPNQRGALGRLESEPFDADDLTDAENKVWAALMPALSGFSALLDIPLFVEHVWVVDTATHASRASAVTPFLDAPIGGLPRVELSNELRAYVSVYREAVNTNSSAYQFLCFYKIIESLRARRGRVQGERASRGESRLRFSNERVPRGWREQVAWLEALFATHAELTTDAVARYIPEPAVGQKLTYIADHHLRPIRDAIAHTLFDEMQRELIVSMDVAMHTFVLQDWLPFTKCAARRLLKNEFPGEFLVGVPDPSSAATADPEPNASEA